MSVLRNVGAFLAGYAVMSIGVIAATWLMTLAVPEYAAAGTGTPPPRWAALNLAYSVLFLVVGAVLAQRIAGGERPVVPIVMGAIMTVLGVATVGSTPSAWPLWYRVGLVVLPLPGAWLGGVIGLRRARGRGSDRDSRQG